MFQKFQLYQLLFVCCVCSATAMLAQVQQETDSKRMYSVQDNSGVQNLFPHTEILTENAGNITIHELLSDTDSFMFEKLADSVVSEKSPVWLRVSIQPETTLTDYQLLFRRTEASGFKNTAAHDSLDVYLVKNREVIETHTIGLYRAASKKTLKTPVTVDRIPMSLKAGEQKTIYAKVWDKNDIHPIMELRHPEYPLVLPSDTQTTALSYFAIILGIYVFCFFFFTKDRSYLYLFAYILASFIHYQIIDSQIRPISLFFPEHPEYIEYVWIISTTLSAICLLQFARKFTNLKQKIPLWDKIAKGAVLLFFVFLGIRIVSFAANPALSYTLESVLSGIGFLTILIITIRMSFLKETLIRYFVFAVGWLIFWNIIGVLWQNGIVPFWESPNPWVLGQGGFMLILSLAIARKLQFSERAKVEIEKAREIDSVKSKFFANISHEFRTPLSLILGPINQSMENIPAAETIENETEVPVKGKHLKVMKRNAIRLQNLVDQILDLSTLDQGKMQLQVTEGDLVAFLRSLTFSFESLMELKHINFKTSFPQSIPQTYFDADKVEKIIVNLLSNATKFTPEHGDVSVLVEEKQGKVKINISDTGSGMSAIETEKIFDRFYQTETTQDRGTGIGLALVKELVELHKGQIHVESVQGEGTTFKLLIPYEEHCFSASEIVTTPQKEITLSTSIENVEVVTAEAKYKTDTSLPLVLIVEDNPDLRTYIAEQLNNDFNILTAKDGKEGVQLAETKIPDLIVSDVMMPKMNGIELCNHLKNEMKTSHIPIILLTAKADKASKMEGLGTGADDYLTKPFDGRELRVRAQNLIDLRQKLRDKFAGELTISPTKVAVTSIDERFIKQLLGVVEHNLDNEYYSVQDLANEVGFSRSQLNRKLKNLTGKSPNQLIREFRLTRAKELLEQKAASVSEVAYQVGYSNLSYFSKSFKEQFGKLPSDI